ncbi:hypothetical protein HSEST_0800 [Halapricum desulfuricans]|uniref:Uncharacterized protein n=1 Tax=Halapricum desulfuricans TaxID=2841257 RepID=A0A897NPH8_9EURY|nr:hypothetical protein HSEST_0800 [Halapricum desulfuricans]
MYLFRLGTQISHVLTVSAVFSMGDIWQLVVIADKPSATTVKVNRPSSRSPGYDSRRHG